MSECEKDFSDVINVYVCVLCECVEEGAFNLDIVIAAGFGSYILKRPP